MEHTLALLRSLGIAEIVVNLYHLPERIAEHFGDGSKYGVRLHYSRETTILGTAGGIKAAQKFLDGEAFLVINADILVDIDLGKVIAYHRQKRSALTLVMRQSPDPGKYGPIDVNADGRIVRFPRAALPEPCEPTARLMFTGIQVMEPEIFSRIPPEKFYGTTKDVFPKMLEDGLPVFAYRHTGYWRDVGDRENYLQAHREILDGKIQVDARGTLNPNHPAVAPPVLIGKGCEISLQARVGPYVVLGDGCRVQSGASVERSVCWSGAVIGAGATVRDSVLGVGARVGNNAKIAGQLVAR
jgi:NDP-sugar pyrophosphorylase family protein